MTLILRDLTFEIQEAEIAAALCDPYWCATYNNGQGKDLSWGLDVYAEPSEEHEMEPPYLYSQSLYFPIRHWMDLAGQSASWEAPCDEVTGKANGGCYVLNHEDISKAHLRFLDRNGPEFRVEWDGLCNIFWDETYGEDVPFSLQTTARFNGVIVYGNDNDTADSMRERLALHLDPDDFIQQEVRDDGNRYDSGIGIRHCLFVPKAEA